MRIVKVVLRCIQTLVAVGALNCAATATAAIEVNLRERVTLNSSVVRLADVARIAAADESQGRRLAELPLMPSPAPGTERFLQQREVADLLSAHGIDGSELRFGGAAQVAIVAAGDGWKKTAGASNVQPARPINRRAAVLAGQPNAAPAASIDAARAEQLSAVIREAVAGYLKKQTGQGGNWQITCETTERLLALVASSTSAPACEGGNPPWAGRQRFVVSFDTPDGAVQVPLYADVRPPAVPAVIVVRPIGRGDVITAAHLELRNVDVSRTVSGRREAVSSIEPVIGMQARQAIRAGDVVFSDQIQPRVLVKRGEVITVSSYGGGIRVRTTARARQDGAEGELVQVESLDTRERFDARVIGPRQAAVLALTRPAAPQEAERVDTARR
jgi:flagellar basal body P-ring formation protein FlgA